MPERMTLRTLLAVLIVLLAANLGMALWNRMAPPEALVSAAAPDAATAPAPRPCALSHYDRSGAFLVPLYRQPFVPGFSGAMQEDMVPGTMRAAPESAMKEAGLVPVPEVACVPASEAVHVPVSGLAQVVAGDTLELSNGTRVRLVYVDTPEAPPRTVTRIVDADTFELSDGTRVRLMGIDAPEMHPSGKLSRDAERTCMDRETIRALGRRATAYASELALDKPVELEYGSGRRTDQYDRTLAYVWVLDEHGQRLYRVNDRMVADGYAKIYSGAPFKYIEEYLEHERQAREEVRGLWETEEGPGLRGACEGD